MHPRSIRKLHAANAVINSITARSGNSVAATNEILIRCTQDIFAFVPRGRLEKAISAKAYQNNLLATDSRATAWADSSSIIFTFAWLWFSVRIDRYYKTHNLANYI
eukprot:SAG31_NODE_4399_length_3269_cov_11.372871_1_plen_106_part_00